MGVDDTFFEQLARRDVENATAPARLKSLVYSAMLRRQAETGSLRSVSETEAAGRALCVFEKAVEIAPVPASIKSHNFCKICHARILAESLEKAPIYWPNCPYAAFHGH
jgi:hypothetical protein